MRSIGATTAGLTALKRALLSVSDDTVRPDEEADCAELLLVAGFADAARMLFELSFVRAGLDDRMRAEQARTLERTNLWAAGAVPAPAEAQTGFAVDIAVRDIVRLMAVARGEGPRTLPLPEDAVARPEVVETIAPGAAADVPDLDGAAFAALSSRLYDALRRADPSSLEPILDIFHDRVAGQPPYRIDAHYDADLTDLAAMVAFNGYRRFMLVHHDLYRAPFGNAALLAAAAQLAEVGLGAYFTNVPRLIREPRDILGMLHMAGGAGDGGRDALERGCVLLSAHLSRDDRVRLADDLGDLGLMRALRGLFDAAERNPGRDHYLYWAIRDAALDNGQTAFAIAVQTAISRLSDNPFELVLLADMHATANAVSAAEAVLEKALIRSPRDRDAMTRLAALRADRFEAYRVERGFGSSAQRTALRQRNRASREAEAGAQDLALHEERSGENG